MLTAASSRWFWPFVFAGYFLAQVGMRLLFGASLELDEAEAFWFARDLALGYGAQPPFYFWLQWVMFQIFGEGILALALLKAALLSTLFIVLFRLLLTELPVRGAAVAAASLSLLPQVVWESQRALTHSVLALTMAVILVAMTWRVVRGARWRDHVWLGLVIGLGILSKYNFALFPAGLFLTVLLWPEWRRGLKPRRLLLAFGVMVLVVLPVLVWSWQNPDIATGSIEKFGLEATGPIMARVIGTGAFIAGLGAFLALAMVVTGWFWAARQRDKQLTWSPLMRFMAFGCLVSLTVLMVSIWVTGVTVIKDRWLLPITWPLVPVAVMGLWPLLQARHRRRLALIVFGLWLLAAALLPYATFREPGYRAADFGALMDRVEELAPGTNIVLSSRVWILGNLALARPDLALSLPGLAPDDAFVLIASGSGGDAMLTQLARDGRTVTTADHVIAHGNRSLRVTISAIEASF
jgi:4-amino-4-deoxy-L-arabinose transferase-like glycosyltransferase